MKYTVQDLDALFSQGYEDDCYLTLNVADEKKKYILTEVHSYDHLDCVEITLCDPDTFAMIFKAYKRNTEILAVGKHITILPPNAISILPDLLRDPRRNVILKNGLNEFTDCRISAIDQDFQIVYITARSKGSDKLHILCLDVSCRLNEVDEDVYTMSDSHRVWRLDCQAPKRSEH